MEKTLRFLGLAAVVGAAGIVVAQQSAARPRAAPPTGSDVPVASASTGLGTSNEVTDTLWSYFASRQHYEGELATLAGRPDLVQPTIHANCAAVLTIQTPEQRARTIKEWDLERYAPNSRAWAEVVKAPILVKRLLLVDARKRAVAAKADEERWAPIRAYSDSMDARLVQTPEWKAAKTKHEQNLAHYAFYQKYGTKTPMVDRMKASLERCEKAMAKVRAALDADERAEFDLIVARFDASMKAAVAGRTAIP